LRQVSSLGSGSSGDDDGVVVIVVDCGLKWEENKRGGEVGMVGGSVCFWFNGNDDRFFLGEGGGDLV